MYYDIHRKFKKYTLYIVRNSYNSTTNHKFTESKPCKNCLATLKKYGIKKIAYTTFDGSLTRQKVNKLETTHLSKAFTYMQDENML